MTITFENEQELIDAIMDSDIDFLAFATLLLDRFGITLCRTHMDLLERKERMTKDGRHRVEGWKAEGLSVYSADDIPAWVKEKVAETDPEITVRSLIPGFVHDCKNYAPTHKNFALTPSGYKFTQDGLDFIMFRLSQDNFITSDDYRRWQFESGFFPHLFNTDGTRKDFSNRKW